MTFKADFDVRGIPKAQPRPRAFAYKLKEPKLTKSGKKQTHSASVFNEGTPENWKSAVVLAGAMWRPVHPLEGPIQARIVFWMPRPKRLMRAKDPEGAILHLTKPDTENLEKPILDALKNDGWFRDDSQVCLKKSIKFYHAKTGAPGAEIYIVEMDDEIDTNKLLASIRAP